MAGADVQSEEKQGGKCCGSCCDYRLGVIILASISLILAIINIPFSVASQFQQQEGRLDIDDQMTNDLESIAEDYNMRFLIIAVISIIMTIVGLVGAVIFNWILVAFYAFWAVLAVVLQIVFYQLLFREMLDTLREYEANDDELTAFSYDTAEKFINIASIIQSVFIVVISLLWIYPSCFFAHEARTGIMSKETYEREKYCCCGNKSS